MLDQDPRLPIDTNFRSPVDGETDHRLPGQQALGNDSRQTFPIAGMHNGIRRMKVVGHCVW